MRTLRLTISLITLTATGVINLSDARADARADALANAKQHLKQSTAPMLSSVFVVVIGYEGNLPLFKQGIIPPPKNGTGLAVPVDREGYFLTAAHSVQTNQDMYLMGSFDEKLEARKATIVHCGDPSTVEGDFAILYVPATLPFQFELAGTLPEKDETVFAIVRSDDKPAFAEGLCQTKSARHTVDGTTSLMTNLPVIGGDSGGPLLNQNLKVVGLTSRGTTNLWGTFTYSCCPSPDLVSKLISAWKTKTSGSAPIESAQPKH